MSAEVRRRKNQKNKTLREFIATNPQHQLRLLDTDALQAEFNVAKKPDFILPLWCNVCKILVDGWSISNCNWAELQGISAAMFKSVDSFGLRLVLPGREIGSMGSIQMGCGSDFSILGMFKHCLNAGR